jgi:hypothetical protein
MENIKRLLSEWKERILFAVVLLATLMIALKARPAGSVSEVDHEQRMAAVSAAGIDSAAATRALNLLESPPEITPTVPDAAQINRPFFDELARFQPPASSAWSLTVEQYQSLPPISLQAPGFPALMDFDTPAGPRPELARVNGLIPRDARDVVLRQQEEGREFEE